MPDSRWPNLPPPTVAQIDAALAAGNKIEAIKIYRQATHCGLKEAKDAIEGGLPADFAPRPLPFRAILVFGLVIVLIFLFAWLKR